MPPTRRTAPALALLLAAIVACSGEHEPVATFDPYAYSFGDAAGDTLANAQALGQRSLDVTGVAGSVDAVNLVLELTFATPVQPWSAQGAGSVDGFVDIDVDQRSETGIPGAAAEYGGSAPLGAEYYLSLRDTHAPGTAVGLVRTGDYSAVSVPATWSGNVTRVTIPRRLLRDDDGQFRISVVVGHPEKPATDFAPSTGFYVVQRP